MIEKHRYKTYADISPHRERGTEGRYASRKEGIINRERLIPVVCNVTNFSKPVCDKPALSSLV